jgi:predicted ATP-dependent endonuclease of OLD family
MSERRRNLRLTVSSSSSVARSVLHVEGEAELLLAHDLLEVVLVDVDRLAILERTRIRALV